MTNKKVAKVLTKSLSMLKSQAPVRTGNLRDNAIKLESKGGGAWVIFVDQKIAPYMPFTNEPWNDPKWAGKQNLNCGWFDDGAVMLIEYIAKSFGGKVRRII